MPSSAIVVAGHCVCLCVGVLGAEHNDVHQTAVCVTFLCDTYFINHATHNFSITIDH